jgi:PAS domain S-box-containing protein
MPDLTKHEVAVPDQLRVLLVEDDPDDAELIVKALRSEGLCLEARRVETEAAFLDALSWEPDVILADYRLPDMNALSVIRIAREQGGSPPVVLVTGAIGEALATDAMKQGAADFLLKDRLGRLGTAVRTAIAVRRAAGERAEIQAALSLERELMESLLETLPDAVYVKDTALRFQRVNSATARQLGLSSPQQAIGRSDSDFFPADLAAEYAAAERSLLASGIPLLSKLERQSMGGEIRWVLATKVPLRDASGTVTGLVGINRDVTVEHSLQEERDRLHTELEAEFARAAEIQAQLLPHATPDLPGYEFAGICLPARQVGGDFFDWLAGDDAIRLSLGDVMGKGMPASLLTATVRAALRVVEDLPVSAAVEAVNRALSPDLIHTDSFVTLFHAALEPESGQLTYVDAGHGMVFIQRRDGEVEELRQRGLPLGVFPDALYPAGTTTLEPGDSLVIYSDGLPDARPEMALDTVGVARQIVGLPDAQAKLKQLVSLVSDIQSRPDDLTLVVLLRREGSVVARDLELRTAGTVGR